MTARSDPRVAGRVGNAADTGSDSLLAAGEADPTPVADRPGWAPRPAAGSAPGAASDDRCAPPGHDHRGSPHHTPSGTGDRGPGHDRPGHDGPGHDGPGHGGPGHDGQHDHRAHADGGPAGGRSAGDAHDGHAGHDHGISPAADRRLLLVALGLIVGFLAVEVVVAVFTGSLALFADAGHMLTDAGAIAAALWAARLAARPARGGWTFGWHRAEILSAIGNGCVLLVVAAVIVVQAVLRLVAPDPVRAGPVLAVALIGMAVNALATVVLARANRRSLNIEGAFQHLLTDLYAFVGTAVAAVVILLTGWVRADAVASLAVAALMVIAGARLVGASGRILLEAAPAGLAVEQVRDHMLTLPEVLAVHDLHVWTVTSALPALSAHVVIADECFSTGCSPAVLDHLQQCLSGHFDVAHSTLQLEPAGHWAHEAGAHT